MPSNSGFSLDYDSVVRIARAVWEVERSLGIPGESEGDKDSGVRNTRLLEVNGALSGGLYPAICKDHDGTNWVYSESCFAVDSNGGTLTVGNTYIGSRTRSVSDGGVAKSVFTVQASGGGGTSGSTFVVVKITSALPPLTGVQSTYNEISKTWSDGTTNLTLVEANGNNIPVGKRVLAMKSGNVYIIGLDPMAVTSVVCNGGTLTVVGRN